MPLLCCHGQLVRGCSQSAMPVLVCSCCNSSTDEHKTAKCGICKKLFKYSCVDLTISEVRALHGKKGLTWNCSNCSRIGGEIRELQAALIDLKNEIVELKKANGQGICSGVDDNTFEEILQELNDREKRKRNVIIFGVSEQRNPNVQTRAAQDKQTVTEILETLSVSEVGDIKALRLGKVSQNESPRPLKVVVKDESMVHEIIRKAKELRNSDIYKDVRISFDRTPRQIRLHRSVQAQLNERRLAGEDNLKIKYVGGIPKIISLN